MDRRSVFEFGGLTLECSISAKPWTPADETVGGTRIAASGVPASYVVARRSMAELTLRLAESEWETFLAFIEYGQGANAFTWFPDAGETDNFTVYLHAPAAGERWAPARDASYPRVFEVNVTLRGVGDVLPWLPYFD